jgi:hypothetical protein
MNSKNGITGFIDILGYQNFIAKNRVSAAVDIISSSLFNLKENVISEINDENKGKISSAVTFDLLHIQTLSDSIIIHYPLDELSGFDLLIMWSAVLNFVRRLHQRLWNEGFPSRGAIDYGEYFFEQGFMVGKPFMEAYQLSQRLELAAVALTPNAALLFQRIIEDEIGPDTYSNARNYLTPVRGGQESLYMLSPNTEELIEAAKTDLAQWVYQKFSAHDKDVGLEVDAKIANTVKMCRFWIEKERIFKSQTL